jgi:carbamoyltransferase
VEVVDDLQAAAANDIASGLLIGWFEAASEFRPRALGHRSILCDARRAGMRDHLNHAVKYRDALPSVRTRDGP